VVPEVMAVEETFTQPAENDLEDMAQIGEGTVAADESTPSDHRADAEQDHLELVDGEIGDG
jgi:hypothetical protein